MSMVSAMDQQIFEPKNCLQTFGCSLYTNEKTLQNEIEKTKRAMNVSLYCVNDELVVKMNSVSGDFEERFVVDPKWEYCLVDSNSVIYSNYHYNNDKPSVFKLVFVLEKDRDEFDSIIGKYLKPDQLVAQDVIDKKHAMLRDAYAEKGKNVPLSLIKSPKVVDRGGNALQQAAVPNAKPQSFGTSRGPPRGSNIQYEDEYFTEAIMDKIKNKPNLPRNCIYVLPKKTAGIGNHIFNVRSGASSEAYQAHFDEQVNEPGKSSWRVVAGNQQDKFLEGDAILNPVEYVSNAQFKARAPVDYSRYQQPADNGRRNRLDQ